MTQLAASKAPELAALAQRLQQAPFSANAAFAYGRAALGCHQEAEALPLLAAATQAQPGNAVVWQLFGLLNRGLERSGAAMQAFDVAARLAPGDASIAHGRARVTLEAGRPAAALFEQARRLAPNDGELLLGRAAARFADGEISLAISELDALLIAHPGWVPGHELIARLRWMVGEREGFARSLDRAIATAPADINLWRTLITLLIHADQNRQALAVITRGRIAAGPHLIFDANEAAAASELGEHARASAIFDQIQGVPDISLAVRHIRHFLRTGSPDRAFARAEPWLRDPQANLLWPYVATAWHLLDDPRAAWLDGDPRLVGVIDLGAALPDLRHVAAHLRGLHQATHQNLDQSVRGGTQTDGPLFARDEPEIRALRAAVVEAVQSHIAQLPARDSSHPTLGRAWPSTVRFSGSWSVRLAGKGRHANHVHPQGWYSSALYVALPPDLGDADSHAGWLALGAPPAELGLSLPPSRYIEPAPGRLVLFPSTMWHGTVPFAQGERLTVAFDVAPAVRA